MSDSYDRISSLYSGIFSVFESSYNKRAFELLNPQIGESILEIGFGPGDNLIKMAKAVGPTGHILGLDLSEKMCKIARKKANKSHLSSIIKIINSNALIETYETDTLDALYMGFTLETFSDEEINQLLDSTSKALKSKGRIVILSMAKSEKRSLIYRLYLWSHKKYPHLVDCRPINSQKYLKKQGFDPVKEINLKIYGLPVNITSFQRLL